MSQHTPSVMAFSRQNVCDLFSGRMYPTANLHPTFIAAPIGQFIDREGDQGWICSRGGRQWSVCIILLYDRDLIVLQPILHSSPLAPK